MLTSKVQAASVLVVAALACGGPDRPPGDPSQGPATGGSHGLMDPTLPPIAPPGTEPPPGPGAPGPSPVGAEPSLLRDLRGPLIAAGMPLDREMSPSAAGSGATSGRPGSSTGGRSTAGAPGIGGSGGLR